MIAILPLFSYKDLNPEPIPKNELWSWKYNHLYERMHFIFWQGRVCLVVQSVVSHKRDKLVLAQVVPDKVMENGPVRNELELTRSEFPRYFQSKSNGQSQARTCNKNIVQPPSICIFYDWI